MASLLDALLDLLGTQILGGPLTLDRLILYILLLIFGWLLAGWLSTVLSRVLLRTFVAKDKDPESKRLSSQGQTALTSYLKWIIFIVVLLISTNVLGLDMNEEYVVGNTGITPNQLVNFTIAVLAVVLFLQLALSPLTRFLTHLFLKNHVDRREEYRLYRMVLKPLRAMLILLGITAALGIVFDSRVPYANILSPLVIFLGLIIASALAASLVIMSLRRAQIYLEPRTKYAPSPMEKLVKYIAFMIALAISLVALGVDIVAVAASLGLIGFALAFGLQDTIANLAAGIMISVDRPFAIGDRIRIGDKWGDVVDIGLRSTRVATPDGEMVIVPNQLVATNEVWNFTHNVPMLRDSVKISISYGSDLVLAEKILLRAAEKHPYVIRSPNPSVRVKEFGESGLNLDLMFWIRDARDMYQIRSDLLKEIKTAFQSQGVEIPYPYRTVVYKKEMPVEAKVEKRDHNTVLDYFSIGQLILPPDGKMPASGGQPLLVPMGIIPIPRHDLPFLLDLASNLDLDMHLLYIYRKKTTVRKGHEIIREITRRGADLDVTVIGHEADGDIEEVLRTAISEIQPSAVVLTLPDNIIERMTGVDMVDLLLEKLNTPLIKLPVPEMVE